MTDTLDLQFSIPAAVGFGCERRMNHRVNVSNDCTTTALEMNRDELRWRDRASVTVPKITNSCPPVLDWNRHASKRCALPHVDGSIDLVTKPGTEKDSPA